MLPMMGGIVGASVVSGQLISHTGRYKIYPILGSALAVPRHVAAVPARSRHAPAAVQRLDGRPRRRHRPGDARPVLAVQNSVARRPRHRHQRQQLLPADRRQRRRRDLRHALRRPAHRLPAPNASPPGPACPTPSPSPRSSSTRCPRAARRLHPAYADAMPRIFLYLVPVLVLGLLIAFFLKEKPLVSHTRPRRDPETAPFNSPIPQARSAYAAGMPVCGTVQHPDGTVVPRAALTLIDVAGQQIGRGASGPDGRYALSTPGSGSYVLIAAAGGHQPQAVSRHRRGAAGRAGRRPRRRRTARRERADRGRHPGAGRRRHAHQRARRGRRQHAQRARRRVRHHGVGGRRVHPRGQRARVPARRAPRQRAGRPARPARTSNSPAAPCCAAPSGQRRAARRGRARDAAGRGGQRGGHPHHRG
jgi:hypothetical protein